ncbi:MAG: DsbA family protein [Acidobacteriia bacterium]|nr:DsbA family protein [Terriglobia bacterium]
MVKLRRITRSFLFALFALSIGVPVARPQANDDVRGLRRDIDAVRDSLKLIQNDLETIKKLIQERPAAAPSQPAAFKETTMTIDGAPSVGQKTAKVTLVEFSDYQCVFCQRHVQQTHPQLFKEYIETGKVRYIFRDFPLESIHPLAFKAAEAARCGGEQGKYFEMHDQIFANQKALAPADLAGYAKTVGLDAAKFKACLDSGKYAVKVRADMAEGRRVGVSGTPGFLLGPTESNGSAVKAVKFINGAQPYANFKEAIDALLVAP